MYAYLALWTTLPFCVHVRVCVFLCVYLCLYVIYRLGWKQWCFRVANESGQVLLLLSVIGISREISQEVQVRCAMMVEDSGLRQAIGRDVRL